MQPRVCPRSASREEHLRDGSKGRARLKRRSLGDGHQALERVFGEPAIRLLVSVAPQRELRRRPLATRWLALGCRVARADAAEAPCPAGVMYHTPPSEKSIGGAPEQPCRFAEQRFVAGDVVRYRRSKRQGSRVFGQAARAALVVVAEQVNDAAV